MSARKQIAIIMLLVPFAASAQHTTVHISLTLFESAQYFGDTNFFKNEWRPSEELSYKVKINKTSLLQRLRPEQRFPQQIANNIKSKNYQYIFLLRYRFEWQFPLKENNTRLLAGNEVFANPGYLNNTLFFDQNTAFTGLSFKLCTSTALCQYMKIFQWYSGISVLENQTAFRLNIDQQFNSRKLNRSHKTA